MRISFLVLIHIGILPRNYYRRLEKNIPTIKVFYADEKYPQKEIFSSFHIREFPIFQAFNKDEFFSRYLPKQIPLGNGLIVKSQAIESQINGLLEEIFRNKKKFKDFKIIKKDFNYFKTEGFLVLKFNDFPLILKLSIETPFGLTHPFNKAFEERGIYTLGGANRYFLGFTRISNADKCSQLLDSTTITIPRKWTWTPKNGRWLKIEGCDLGGKPYQEISTPAIYALVCEEVCSTTKPKTKDKRDYLKLCTELEYKIDPHSNNFTMCGKKKNLIDTEHFPTLIGSTKKIKPCSSY